jgi:hypothetical protein
MPRDQLNVVEWWSRYYRLVVISLVASGTWVPR